MKKKLLVYHNTLAPYRIDLFNALNEAFDFNIYFFRKNLREDKFDMSKLLSQLNFEPKFITSGLEHPTKDRMLRFGYLKKIYLHNPDVIMCLEYNLMTFITAAYTKLFFPKIKVYTTSDDSVDVAENCAPIRKIGRFFCFWFLDGVVLGNDLAEVWYNRKFPKVRTTVIPIIQKEERLNSIIKNAQPITNEYIKRYKLENKKVLLFVGRLVAVKNLDFLIEVFSRFVSTNKDVKLILVGDGKMKNELIKLTESLKIQENVIFAGRHEYDALYAWYPIADYFILPSTYEPFGAVVNESLIAGVPVICSNLAGASSLINDKNGIIFNPTDKEELLSILNDVFDSKNTSIKKTSNNISLMPYTFKQRMDKLTAFLRDGVLK